MKPSLSDHSAFLAGSYLPGLRFKHNDYVRVVAGTHAGTVGSLISVEDLGSDPVFLIELDSNKDALVQQSSLVLVDTQPHT